MRNISIPFLVAFFLWLALGGTTVFASEGTSPDQAQRPLFNPLEPPPPPHDFGDNDPNVILAMGDSITEGVPFVPANQTYPAQLQAMLGRTVINAGLGGARSRYGVETIDRFLRRHKPGYVLIMFGANDVLERSADEITNNLLIIARKARENKSIPILATVTPVAGSRDVRTRYIQRLNNTIIARAAEFDYLVADVNTAFGTDGQYLLSDGLHPNSAGNEVIARIFLQKILTAEQQTNSGGGDGGGGCVLQPDANPATDLLLLILACLLIIGVRSLRKSV